MTCPTNHARVRRDPLDPDEGYCLDCFETVLLVKSELTGTTKEQRRMYMNVKAKEAVSADA